MHCLLLVGFLLGSCPPCVMASFRVWTRFGKYLSDQWVCAYITGAIGILFTIIMMMNANLKILLLMIDYDDCILNLAYFFIWTWWFWLLIILLKVWLFFYHFRVGINLFVFHLFIIIIICGYFNHLPLHLLYSSSWFPSSSPFTNCVIIIFNFFLGEYSSSDFVFVISFLLFYSIFYWFFRIYIIIMNALFIDL